MKTSERNTIYFHIARLANKINFFHSEIDTMKIYRINNEIYAHEKELYKRAIKSLKEDIKTYEKLLGVKS